MILKWTVKHYNINVIVPFLIFQSTYTSSDPKRHPRQHLYCYALSIVLAQQHDELQNCESILPCRVLVVVVSYELIGEDATLDHTSCLIQLITEITAFSSWSELTIFPFVFYILFFQPNDFSISLKAQSKNKHFKVQLKDSLYCIGQRKFNTMEELVEHYKKAPIFTSEQGDKLYLVKALAAS